MPLTYSDSLRQQQFALLLGAVDSGKLHIGTSGMASTLVSFQLASPAGYLTNAYEMVLTSPLVAIATATGTAETAWLTASDGSLVAYDITVGTSGTEIVLTTTNVDAGDYTNLNTAVIRNGN